MIGDIQRLQLSRLEALECRARENARQAQGLLAALMAMEGYGGLK